MRGAMKLLCTETREVEKKLQIVALRGVGIKTMDTIMISRQSIPFLDELCTQKGIVGKPVIFQTAEEKKAKKSSIVGTGAIQGEKTFAGSLVRVLDICFKDLFVLLTCCVCFFCRKHGLLAVTDKTDYKDQANFHDYPFEYVNLPAIRRQV